MQAQSIQEVINALDGVILQCETRGSRQAYFALLYRDMTVAVRDAIRAGAFADNARMEQLDVVFANRYLTAWQQYNLQQPVTRSWQAAFDACADDAPIVLQHLVLGVNTHINLDLAIAAATTAPGESIMDMQSDFNKINDIIASLTDGMQARLERIWWPMHFIRRVMRNRDKAVIEFSITKARQMAWTNATALAQLPDLGAAAYIEQMDNTVCLVAGNIRHPRGWAAYALRFIRWWEPKTVGEVVAMLRGPS
jgi:hypothetical protein